MENRTNLEHKLRGKKVLLSASNLLQLKLSVEHKKNHNLSSMHNLILGKPKNFKKKQTNRH